MSDPNVGVLMFVAHRAMEERVLAALRLAGFDDVTLAQGRVFARIGHGGTRLTDLAAMAQVTKQTAGRGRVAGTPRGTRHGPAALDHGATASRDRPLPGPRPLAVIVGRRVLAVLRPALPQSPA